MLKFKLKDYNLNDTIAAIAGGIASAFYKKIPLEILNQIIDILPIEFLQIIEEFDKRYK